MKKIIFVMVLILISVILTGCGSTVASKFGERFVEIEHEGCATLCYDKDTLAVYIAFSNIYQFGLSPYIVFDEFGHATVGIWNGEEIIPSK